MQHVNISISAVMASSAMSNNPPVVIPASGNNIIISPLQVCSGISFKEAHNSGVDSEGILSWKASEMWGRSLATLWLIIKLDGQQGFYS